MMRKTVLQPSARPCVLMQLLNAVLRLLSVTEASHSLLMRLMKSSISERLIPVAFSK